MGKNKNLYTLSAVSKYLDDLERRHGCVDVDVIPGALLDTLVIYHGIPGGVQYEVFEEAYINPWESAYTRHLYRKSLPARFSETIVTAHDE